MHMHLHTHIAHSIWHTAYGLCIYGSCCWVCLEDFSAALGLPCPSICRTSKLTTPACLAPGFGPCANLTQYVMTALQFFAWARAQEILDCRSVHPLSLKQIYFYVQGNRFTLKRPCMHVCTHTCICTHACMHACMHIHTYIHTYIGGGPFQAKGFSRQSLSNLCSYLYALCVKIQAA